MKKLGLLFFALAFLAFFAEATPVRAQGSVSRGPDPAVLKDAELEKEAAHNLEVARHYFKFKKAYRAAVARCEEIIAGYPNFTRLDEALYIAGASSLRLSENRGKQAANLPAEKLREEAREYLSRLVNEFPESVFRKDAEKELLPLGGAKKPEEKKQ
ncbi:MAG TPA: outer membrane protein assembly factor BamD [Pyrinomonadaceae bacterium]|nr:outer membrane protein assembly factor BamD [Pyrinomonadaceae bacterium]